MVIMILSFIILSFMILSFMIPCSPFSGAECALCVTGAVRRSKRCQ